MERVRQAGAIAVRRKGGRAEVFVVRAKRNPVDWIFPKGHIEAGEDAPVAAVRELLEEGGVVGDAGELVGVSSFRTGSKLVEVSYYLVWFKREGLPAEPREKQWLTFDAARATLSYEDARRFLDTVERLLGRTSS